MVQITQYGPVLDPVIEVVKELTQCKQAEVRVPLQPEAVGLAVDINRMLINLDNYIDSIIFPPKGLPLLVPGKHSDFDVEGYKVTYIFKKGSFDIPISDDFSQYPPNTIIDLEDEDYELVEKSRVSVSAKNTPKAINNIGKRMKSFIRNPRPIPLRNESATTLPAQHNPVPAPSKLAHIAHIP